MQKHRLFIELLPLLAIIKVFEGPEGLFFGQQMKKKQACKYGHQKVVKISNKYELCVPREPIGPGHPKITPNR